MRSIKKTIYTLNVDAYSEQITNITYPFIKDYARKIDAEFVVINERKFPSFPAVYEKLQIHELGKDNDWSIYIDSDVLVHPDLFDFTVHLNKDTVLHYNKDLAGNRWKYDKYFLRDGRHISSCNWFAIASDWCIDLWHPLDDMSLEEATANITPAFPEMINGITPSHLIDDYILSRNIAKYGLKFTTCHQIFDRVDSKNAGNLNYFWHEHLLSEEQKVRKLQATLRKWGFTPVKECIPADVAARCLV